MSKYCELVFGNITSDKKWMREQQNRHLVVKESNSVHENHFSH